MAHNLQSAVHHRRINIDYRARTYPTPIIGYPIDCDRNMIGYLRKALMMKCRLHHRPLAPPRLGISGQQTLPGYQR
jgi:hypothetical protein